MNNRNQAEEMYLEARITGDIGAAIERQEKIGQRQLAGASKLPIKLNVGTREQFEAMGVVYHQPIDDLFVAVTLPDGWQVKPTSHSMWSHLLDDKGRERASIFYKAAFYDRDAFISIHRRYRTSKIPDCGWDSEQYHSGWQMWVAAAFDGDAEIWRSEVREGDSWVVGDELEKMGDAWINEHYPNWRDPLAYWD